MDPLPVDEKALQEAIGALADGEDRALDQVFRIAYDDLRLLARARLRSLQVGQTLNTTALVHEAFLKVRRGSVPPRWKSPQHFFAFASKAMRHILVDHARRRGATSRGGSKWRQVTLDSRVFREDAEDPIDLLELDRGLTILGKMDRRLERVVECRFFSGLTAQETADTLGVSLRTVERDWLKARTYLRRLMAR